MHRNYSEASQNDVTIMRSDRQVFPPTLEELIKLIVQDAIRMKRITPKDSLEYSRQIYAVVFGSNKYKQLRKTRQSVMTSNKLFKLAGAKFSPSSKFKAYYNKMMKDNGVTPKKSRRRII
jgi:hypothetical protein